MSEQVNAMNCVYCKEPYPEECIECPQCGRERTEEPILTGEMAAADTKQARKLLAQANLSRMRGDFSHALELCIAVLKAEPENATAHSLLGDIYREQGRLEDAARWYRMAADISDNAADRLRLAEVERDMNRLLAAHPEGEERSDTDIEFRAGTASLAGYSPRRWLQVITVVSVLFLAAALILIFTHPAARPTVANHAAGLQTAAAPAPFTPQPTLPLPSAPAGNQTGEGFPSDSGQFAKGNTAPAQTEPAMPSVVTPAPQTGGPSILPGIGPAPVKSGGEASSALSAPIPSKPPLDTSLAAPSALTSGMQLQQAIYTGNGTAVALLNAPVTALQGQQSTVLERVVRNMARSAVWVLRSNPLYTQAQIFVEINTASGQESVAQGELSRKTAHTIHPDTDTAAALQNAFKGFQLVIPSSANANAVATGAGS